MREVVDPRRSEAEGRGLTDEFGRSSMSQLVAQQAAIAQIGQLALAETSRSNLFDRTCAVVSQVLETEYVSILELSADREILTVVAGVGWRPSVIGTSVPAGASQSGYTISRAGPVIVADLAAEDRFGVPPVLTEHGVKSGMSVPIGDETRAFGVLAAFTARANRFTRDDANFLQAVANILAAAVERFRVESELRASRNELSAIVSGIDEGITVQGPDGRLLYANDTAARLSGFESAAAMLEATLADFVSRFQLVDEDGQPLGFEHLPGRRVMAGEQPPPTLVGFRIAATGDQRWSLVSAVGLPDADGTIRRVVNTFRDVTDERRIRQSRELMADAVAALSSTLDSAEAARRLARIAVPRLADYCIVHLLEPSGAIASVALEHADPGRIELARRAQEINPVDPNAPTGVAKVIREGVPESGQITPEMIEQADISPELREVILALDIRWYVMVPLMGRHGPVGALSLVTAESGRRLDEHDLELALELGARSGIALENAQLYQTADDRRAQLDTVLAALAEAVLVFDAGGALRLANQAADRTLGGRMPADIDELWRRVGLDPAALDGHDGSGGTGIEVTVDEGREWFDLHLYRAPRPTDDGASPGPTVLVMRDITSERAARAARDAFMGVLSHELRTPITTIYGGSELLERDLDDQGRREIVADIRSESERLARLVEDLLVMTRVERGMVEIADEPILLQHLIGSVVGAVTARSPGTAIEIRAAERLPAVRGDTTYIEQVVRNLLTNALRYGHGREDGIEVLIEEDSGQVAVRVLDRGPGFGGESPERLFDLFFRTPTARAVPGGAGIGLFVCRHLIEAMGGRIWAAERQGGGAEFGFTLPVLDGELTS